MKNLSDLAKQICKVALIDGKEYGEFFKVWYKIMSKYPFEVVLKTWDNILEDTELTKWDYFVTNKWVIKADYIYYKQKQTEKPSNATERPKRIDTTDEKKWKHNVTLYTTGQIVRWQYILNALQIKQFTADDFVDYLNYISRTGRKMCDKAINTLKVEL